MNETKLLGTQITRIFELKRQAQESKMKADTCRPSTSDMVLSYGYAKDNLIIRPYHSSILQNLKAEHEHMAASFDSYSEAIAIEESIRAEIQIFELKEFFVGLQMRGLLHGLGFYEEGYGYALRCDEFGSFIWQSGSMGRYEGLIEHYGALSEPGAPSIFSVSELKGLISCELDLD